jgi:hypothetical protein
MIAMPTPETNATTDANARRARRLLIGVMVAFIVLPWLLLLLGR